MTLRLLRGAPALTAALRTSRVIDMGTADAFSRAHLPGALRSPLRGDLKGPDGVSPLSLPDAAHLFSALSLHASQPALVYDSGEALPAARLAWILRYYGHPDVAVLDGGFGAYLECGGAVPQPCTAYAAAPAPAAPAAPLLAPTPQPELLARAQDVLAALHTAGGAQLLDARSPAEFCGASAHGLPRAGHIPGAINVPFADCLAPGTRRYLPQPELQAVLSARGVDLGRPAIVLCLAGVRASVLLMALHAAGAPSAGVRLYDGSMAEWSQDPSLPIKSTA